MALPSDIDFVAIKDCLRYIQIHLDTFRCIQICLNIKYMCIILSTTIYIYLLQYVTSLYILIITALIGISGYIWLCNTVSNIICIVDHSISSN